jgi:lipoate synthase
MGLINLANGTLNKFNYFVQMYWTRTVLLIKNIHPVHRIENHVRYGQNDFATMKLLERVKQYAPQAKVVMAGRSFGGYHAAKFCI